MQITLNQDEIETAIKDYVSNQIVIAEDMEIAIDMKAGRGDNGYTATLDIRPAKVKSKKPVYRQTSNIDELPVAEPKAAIPTAKTEIFSKKVNDSEESKADASEEVAVTKEESLKAMDGNEKMSLDAEENKPTTDEAVVEEPKPIEAKKPGSIFNFAKTGTE